MRQLARERDSVFLKPQLAPLVISLLLASQSHLVLDVEETSPEKLGLFLVDQTHAWTSDSSEPHGWQGDTTDEDSNT